MINLLATLLPIYLIFALGVILRKAGVFRRDDATVLLKIIFYVCLPSLLIYAIQNVELSREYAKLPVIAPVIVLLTTGLSWGAGRLLRLPRPTQGTFFAGTLVMNITFMYPVIQGLYGIDGISKLAMFDAGQGMMAFSFSYFVACLYSDQSTSGQFRDAFVNVCKSPPLWAIVVGVSLNLLHIPLPDTLNQTLLFLGDGTTVVIMLAMGILFVPAIAKLPALLAALAIRMVGGSLLGLGLATLLGLQGDARMVAILAAASPAGHSALTFSALKGLDIELAAALVPISAMFGILYIPLLLAFL